MYQKLVSFQIPAHLVIKATEHWVVNHRVDANLPGYLIVASRHDTSNLFDLPSEAMANLGPLLAEVQRHLQEALCAEHVYIGRFGHQGGHSFHFHVIPIYRWLKDAFTSETRYSVLKTFYTPNGANTDFDGAELTLYVWREFCERATPPQIHGTSREQVIEILRGLMS